MKTNELEKILTEEGLKITRQDKQPRRVMEDLRAYIDWINTSRIIVTSDSLGMHLALSLKKKVHALFGPTPSFEVYFYGRGEAILPEPKLECVPGFSERCDNPEGNCINKISAKRVAEKVLNYTITEHPSDIQQTI